MHENTQAETITASTSAAYREKKQSQKVQQDDGLDSSSSSVGHISSEAEDDDDDEDHEDHEDHDTDGTTEDVDDEQSLEDSIESADEDSDDSSFSLDNARELEETESNASGTEQSKAEMPALDAVATEPESPMPAPSPAPLPAVTAPVEDVPAPTPSPLRKRRRLRPSSVSAAATAASLDVADSQDEISDPEDPIAIMTSSSNPQAISPFRSPSQHAAAPPVVIGTSLGVRRIDGQQRHKKKTTSVLQKLAQAQQQQQQQKNQHTTTPVLDLTQLVSVPDIELLSKEPNHDSNPSSDEHEDDYGDEPMAVDEQPHEESPQEFHAPAAPKQNAQSNDIPAAADVMREASVEGEEEEPGSPAYVSFWSMLLPYGPYFDL